MSQVINKAILPGIVENLPVFCTITHALHGKNWRLSITGVHGPRADGNCYGSCGQIIDTVRQILPAALAPGWTFAMLAEFCDAWERWHLSDMCAGCSHQRDNWNTSAMIEVVEYGLTTGALTLRKQAIEAAARATANYELADLNYTARALILLEDWFSPRYSPPDADSPLSGCYEVKKRCLKSRKHVLQTEHPDGLLLKPCEVCDYRYGSKWLYEPVPAQVLTFLAGLPDAEQDLPAAWR